MIAICVPPAALGESRILVIIKRRDARRDGRGGAVWVAMTDDWDEQTCRQVTFLLRCDDLLRLRATRDAECTCRGVGKTVACFAV